MNFWQLVMPLLLAAFAGFVLGIIFHAHVIAGVHTLEGRFEELKAQVASLEQKIVALARKDVQGAGSAFGQLAKKL